MIECRGLTKRYGMLRAVDDLSFTVGPGEVLGFLGPNGAGKTTTMRMVAGFLPPSAGRAIVCGRDVVHQGREARRLIGYLPEGAPSYPEMSPDSFLGFIADARGLRGAERRRRIERVVELLHLENVLHQSIDTLSKGYRRRVGLAQAIIHDPDVLILDEPTDGLDPNQKHEVRQLIGAMSEDKIVVISTHLLEEVDALCTRAIIISGGRLLADDTPAGLRSRSRYHGAVSLRLSDPSVLEAARRALERLDEVDDVETDARTGRLTAFARGDRIPLPAVSGLAESERWPLEELHAETGRLDDVFRAITAGASA